MAVLAPLALAVGPTLASGIATAGVAAGTTAGITAATGALAAANATMSIGSFFAAASPYLSAISGVGTVMSALGARNAGISANQEAEYRAQQEKIQAGQTLASSQRQQVEQIRQMRLVESRGQALAASSGAGALDPSVMDIMGDLETQGRYKAAVAGYEGQDSANNLESKANLDMFSGSQAQSAGNIKAISTLMSGASSLYSKYDGGGTYH